MMTKKGFYLIGHGRRSSMSDKKRGCLKGGSQLQHGDSANLLKKVASNSVDAVITDPPY